jgi:hypothetical protein
MYAGFAGGTEPNIPLKYLWNTFGKGIAKLPAKI